MWFDELMQERCWQCFTMFGDDAAAWQAEVEALWGGRYANVKAADSAYKALQAFGVRAPMEAAVGTLVASRRVIDGRDFYFVLNDASAEFDGAVSFAAPVRTARPGAVRERKLRAVGNPAKNF